MLSNRSGTHSTHDKATALRDATVQTMKDQPWRHFTFLLGGLRFGRAQRLKAFTGGSDSRPERLDLEG